MAKLEEEIISLGAKIGGDLTWQESETRARGPGQENSTTGQNPGSGLFGGAETRSYVEILRAAYARVYQTADRMRDWPFVQQSLGTFMPIWNQFEREDWADFSSFKAKMMELANGVPLPKPGVFEEMYDVERQARVVMGYFHPVLAVPGKDKDLPRFDARDVFWNGYLDRTTTIWSGCGVVSGRLVIVADS
ncbi:hypothetical protein V8F33_004736 [Rhypophila sp. PSN 637]